MPIYLKKDMKSLFLSTLKVLFWIVFALKGIMFIIDNVLKMKASPVRIFQNYVRVKNQSPNYCFYLYINKQYAMGKAFSFEKLRGLQAEIIKNGFLPVWLPKTQNSI